jgi:hypothetical protein
MVLPPSLPESRAFDIFSAMPHAIFLSPRLCLKYLRFPKRRANIPLIFVIMMIQCLFFAAAGFSIASCHTIFVQLVAEGKTNGMLRNSTCEPRD